MEKYHHCFVKPFALSKPTVKANYHGQVGEYVFYDIETMKEEKAHGTTKFVPNLVVCQHQDGTEWVFQGVNAIDLFCNWLFKTREGLSQQGRKFILVAHNASGFDVKFILEWMANHLVETPQLTVNGQRVISMKVGKLTFIDSFRFIPCALNKFKKILIFK